MVDATKAGGAALTEGLHSTPFEIYRQRLSRNEATAEASRSRRNVLSWVRLPVFILAASALYGAYSSPDDRLRGAVIGFLLLGGFALLVRMQRRADDSRAKALDLARLNREAIARLGRDWSSVPLPLPDPALESSPLARDLTLTGRGSLLQLLGTARSAEGRRILGEWLIAEAQPETILARQAAVRELAPMLDLRQELERLAMRTPKKPGVLEPFHLWAVTGSWLLEKPWLLTLARGLPLITIALILLFMAGLVAAPLWLALLPIHALVWVATAPRTAGELAHLEMRAGDLDRFASIFALISSTRFDSERLARLQHQIQFDGRSADLWLRRLAHLVEYAEVRTTPLLYIPLQLVTLWDLHLIALIDRWREQVGEQTRTWLESVGEIEALSALAALCFDNPEWALPEVDPAAERWRVTSLGHPLIPAERRIANDVEIGPPGSFLLVTGSNMSGKSTLMRAVGVNVVLAQAGGPVCAASMSMPPTRLGAAFVIEDSLEDGISYFMAELRRLKEIVDEAHASSGGGSRYMFLLDEILKGTNSGERQIAVRRILQELLDSGASGAVSTHDLALAEVDELKERSSPVHFTETFLEVEGVKTMDFDYRLRPGVATSTNALALLEMVGIRTKRRD